MENISSGNVTGSTGENMIPNTTGGATLGAGGATGSAGNVTTPSTGGATLGAGNITGSAPANTGTTSSTGSATPK